MITTEFILNFLQNFAFCVLPYSSMYLLALIWDNSEFEQYKFGGNQKLARKDQRGFWPRNNTQILGGIGILILICYIIPYTYPFVSKIKVEPYINLSDVEQGHWYNMVWGMLIFRIVCGKHNAELILRNFPIIKKWMKKWCGL